MLKAIKYGRRGSTHEKEDAIPVLPAIRANTGMIQQEEASIAEIKPVLANLTEVFAEFMLRRE